MKKVLVLVLSLVLVASMALSGTIAYLTSTDSDVNVMTVGNVKIEQIELQRAEGVAHDAGAMGAGNGVKEGDLVPFEQGKPLYPAFPKTDDAYIAEQANADLFFWGDYVFSGTAGNGLWNDNKLVGAQDKFVFVKNTGSSDAYFRTIIALECPEDSEFGWAGEQDFLANFNSFNNTGMYQWADALGYHYIDGVRYAVYCATYKNALKPGQTSHPSLLQVVMTHNADNDVVAKLGDSYEILTLSQAVQVTNFEGVGAEVALNTAFGELNEANIKEWFGDEATTNIYRPETQAEINALAPKAGETVLLPAGEYSLTSKLLTSGANIVGAGASATTITNPNGESAISGSLKDVTVSGMKISDYNSLRWCYANGEVVFEDCEIIGDNFNAHFDGGSGNVTFRNCKMAGWNSFGGALDCVTFENCDLSMNNYAAIRFFCDGKVIGCTFSDDYQYIQASGSDTTIVVEDCSANIYPKLQTKANNVTWIIDGVTKVESV